MSESTAEIASNAELSRNVSAGVLEKAWHRAAPVLKTATGVALLTLGLSFSASAFDNLKSFVSNPTLLTGIGTVISTSWGFNMQRMGIGLMKEPVENALKYFKSQPWKKQ